MAGKQMAEQLRKENKEKQRAEKKKAQQRRHSPVVLCGAVVVVLLALWWLSGMLRGEEQFDEYGALEELETQMPPYIVNNQSVDAENISHCMRMVFLAHPK